MGYTAWCLLLKIHPGCLPYLPYLPYLLTILTIWNIPRPYLPYLHTYLPYLPHGIYRMMPSPTDSPNVVESHTVSMYGKYVSILPVLCFKVVASTASVQKVSLVAPPLLWHLKSTEWSPNNLRKTLWRATLCRLTCQMPPETPKASFWQILVPFCPRFP